MRKSHFGEEQIIRFLEHVQAGEKVMDVCREHKISEGTYHRWKAKYSGPLISKARRLRELEQEKWRLKSAVAELTLDKQAGNGGWYQLFERGLGRRHRHAASLVEEK